VAVFLLWWAHPQFQEKVAFGRSIFTVTREGKVVEWTAAYVVGMKGQK
jgi:hypothetical protein